MVTGELSLDKKLLHMCLKVLSPKPKTKTGERFIYWKVDDVTSKLLEQWGL